MQKWIQVPNNDTLVAIKQFKKDIYDDAKNNAIFIHFLSHRYET